MNKRIITGSAFLIAATTLAMAGANQKALVLPDGTTVQPSMAVSKSTVLTVKPLPLTPASQPLASPILNAGDDLKPYGKWYKEDVADDHINYWVFQCMGLGAFPKGIIHGTTPYSANRDYVKLWGPDEGKNWSSGEFIINSGCMVGDEYWAYCSKTWAQDLTYEPDGIYQIDLTTGERLRKIYDDTENAANYNCVLNEMSFDPITEYIYGLRKIASGYLGWDLSMEMEVVRIDARNPSAKWEVIGTVDYALGMACDDGYMYLVRPNLQLTGEVDDEGNPISDFVNCSLFKINLEEYGSFDQNDLTHVGLINNGFLNINYLQTMEFDHSDHTLYWIGCKYDTSGTGFITTLDTELAETGDPLWDMVERVQYVAMAIPYELADKRAPHYVRSLIFTAGSEGKGSVTFSWTNPSKNTAKTALDALTGVKVYRDGELLADVAATGVGQEQTWSDDNVISGFHNYKFVTYNSDGDGLSRSRTIFIGRDVPGAPVDVNITADGPNATISWRAASAGANLGWYDKASLTYTVTRMPDNVVIASDTEATSVDDTVDTFGGYSYIITPRNVDGEGVAAYSAIVPFGPAVSLPYVNNLETEARANEMRVVDLNADGNKFNYSYSPNDGVSMVWLYDYNASKPNDWLITPELNFDPDKKYQVRIEYATSNYRGTQELLHIKQGTTKEPETHTKCLADIIGLSSYFGAYRTEIVSNIDPADGNYISFHVDSEPNQGWVVFSSIQIREYSATDVSVLDFTGSEMAYVNSENFYQVTVKNEGNAATRAAKAQIVKEDGTVLAEANVGALAAGASKVVEVSWTPTEAGEYTIYGRAFIAGDTFEDDNVYIFGIPVVVKEGVASRWTTVLKQDNFSWQPFYVMYGNCENTVIYKASEVGKKDITLTGVAYTYAKADNPDDEGLKEITVDVYACETDLEYVYKNNNFVSIPGLDKVGTATVNMSGTSAKNDITIMFDRPIRFSGEKNLAINAVATVKTRPQDGNNPYWYIHDEFGSITNNARACYGLNDSQFTCEFPPVIKLGYTDSSGLTDVMLVGGYTLRGNVMDFAMKMDTITVYDIAGRIVSTVQNTEAVTLPKGLYFVRSSRNGVQLVSKVLIK